ncbi:MAG: acyltransferase [Smithellaceae bacterium]|nr:acyltransferase [Smithellaceae bacterium]
MRVGFVQFDPKFGEIDLNIRKAMALAESGEADLMVLPEFFNTGYLLASKEEAFDLSEEIPRGKTTIALCDLAARKKMHIVAGLIERAGDLLFNAAVLVGPNGYIATYRKMHLFNEEKFWFSSGDLGFDVHDIGDCRVGIMICFDWFFPESMRILALKGAEVICHSANLVLPYCQDAMKVRCLENRVYAVTANRTGEERRDGKCFRYTGKSQITGPNADILYRASDVVDEVGSVEIEPRQARSKKINVNNDLFADRRIEYYGELLK